MKLPIDGVLLTVDKWMEHIHKFKAPRIKRQALYAWVYASTYQTWYEHMQ